MKSAGESLPASNKPSFIADAMLGSVARKLRIFGFDTLYVAHIPDDEILNMGITENRIILTCDQELFKRMIKAQTQGVLLHGIDEVDDIVHIFSKFGINSINLENVQSRCSSCNGSLNRINPNDVRGLIPHRVTNFHQVFYRCVLCSKVYWDGSHFEKLRMFTKKINEKLKIQN